MLVRCVPRDHRLIKLRFTILYEWLQVELRCSLAKSYLSRDDNVSDSEQGLVISGLYLEGASMDLDKEYLVEPTWLKSANYSQARSSVPPPLKILLINVLFKSWISSLVVGDFRFIFALVVVHFRVISALVVVHFRFIAAFMHAQWTWTSHARQSWNFCRLNFLKFDVNVFK